MVQAPVNDKGSTGERSSFDYKTSTSNPGGKALTEIYYMTLASDSTFIFAEWRAHMGQMTTKFN